MYTTYTHTQRHRRTCSRRRSSPRPQPVTSLPLPALQSSSYRQATSSDICNIYTFTVMRQITTVTFSVQGKAPNYPKSLNTEPSVGGGGVRSHQSTGRRMSVVPSNSLKIQTVLKQCFYFECFLNSQLQLRKKSLNVHQRLKK